MTHKFSPGDRIVSPVTVFGESPEGYVAGTVIGPIGNKMYLIREEDDEISEAYEDDLTLESEFEGVIHTISELEKGDKK